MELRRVIASDRQPAALHGSIFGERRDDHVTAWTKDAPNLSDITLTINRREQKVKYGAVMPDIDGVIRKVERQSVAGNPPNALAPGTESRPSSRKSVRRDVDHREVRVTERKQRIDERRSATADVDDCGSMIRSGLLHESKGKSRFALVPTDLGHVLRSVDRFPVFTIVHGVLLLLTWAKSLHDA